MNSQVPYSSVPEFDCDCKNHKEKQAHGKLTMWFWYGSEYDIKQGSIHLCDECAKEVMNYLKQKFNTEKFLTKIEEL
jgi:hypothetical protein